MIEGTVVSPEIQRQHRKGELIFFWGVLLTSTIFLGPIGFPLMAWGQVLSRRAQRQGAIPSLPWHVALVGGFAIGDSAANFIGWSIDLFAGRAVITATAEFIYGKVFDGGYAQGINAGHVGEVVLGGISSPGEKALILAAVLVVWPCRLAAAWGFMKGRPWGLGWMITSSWMMVVFWIIWVTNAVIETETRFDSFTGVIGMFLFNGVYFVGPLLMIPYLYLIDQRPWLWKARVLSGTVGSESMA